MSSKLSIPHHTSRTPSLKRNTQQHCMLRDSAKRFEELPIQSRLQIAPSCLFDTRKLNTKSRILDDSPTKDGTSSVSSTLSEERAENSSSEVVKINNLLEQVIEEDLKTVQRKRQRLGYSHTYEERDSFEEVWIGQPKQIPQEVFQALDSARKNLRQDEKINCHQGFLSQIGVLYFSIEDYVLFYDADSMNSKSENICSLKLNQRPLQSLQAIQVFTLGLPYFQAKRNVMVMLHPFEAQFYHYEIRKNIDGKQKKILKLRTMGFRFPLPQKRPNKFSLSSKGYLYTTDNRGKIYKVDFQDHFWNIEKRELQARTVNISALAFAKNSAKRLANSLASFYRSVKNYSLSFFASKETETQILFDEDKEMILVFVKQRSQKFKQREISQSFHIYDEKSNELLYILKDTDTDFLRLDKEIILMKKIEMGENSKYNFILLLKSGQRVLLDLQNDRLKKHFTIKRPPLSNSQININRSVQISAFFLDETLMAQITSNYNSNLVLTKQSSKQSQTVLNLKVQSSETSYVYHKKLVPFGQRKQIFLNYDKNKLKTQNWPQICRQVFYPPHQIYYSTDQIIQTIKILRPIDILFSIFTFFSENIPTFFKKLKKIMPQNTPRQIICLCCQILVDPQGIYYVSYNLQNQGGKRTSILQRQGSNELRRHSFRDIERKDRIRLIQIMLDCAVNAGSNKEQREKILIEGILQYYGKLLRCIYITNINNLSSETCKVVSCVLQQLRKFLLQLQGYFKCDCNSYIGATLKWVNKTWQILILSKDIPDLPDLTLHDAIIQNSRTFQPHIFRFLIKECNEEVFNQIKKLMPCLISNQFTILYHLYCEISPMKDLQAILAICKKHTYLPDYFIQYLVKSKKITEAVLLKQYKDKQSEKGASYNQKMKQFYSRRSSLYEKEQLLIHASILLSQQCKRQKKEKKEQYQQLKTLQGQLKLQELMIKYYHQRVVNKSTWTRIISKFIQKDLVNAKQQEIIDRLNTCLLDQGFLYEIIEQLDCNMLRVMYTYYFDPSSFQSKFFDLARQIFDENNLDLQALNAAYQNELHFMLVKAKLAFKFEQIPIILHAYITLLAQSPSLQEALTIESSLIKKELFWPLTYSAEIGIDALKLYKWALTHLSQLDKHSQEYLYLVICCAYLVRDYLSDKKNDLINLLKCDESLRPELKQVYTLILA